VLAYRDHRRDEMVVYASIQTSHTIRVALGECSGLEERRIRIIAPDVGDGFGPKALVSGRDRLIGASLVVVSLPYGCAR
jgi:carbon-monoxide dehydrogenase large subunit